MATRKMRRPIVTAHGTGPPLPPAGTVREGRHEFARVIYALDHPAEFDLSDKARKVLLWRAGPHLSAFRRVFSVGRPPRRGAGGLRQAACRWPRTPRAGRFQSGPRSTCGRPRGKALAGLEPSFDKHLSAEGTAPYELLADMLKKLGKEKELLGPLEKLRQADPENVPLGYALAAQYRGRRRGRQGRDAVRGPLEETAPTAAYRGLAEMLSPDQAQRRAAGPRSASVIGEDRRSLEALGDEAKQIVDDAGLLRSLIEAARQKIKTPPDKRSYGLPLAVALLALEAKQYEAAGEFFEAAIATRPSRPANCCWPGAWACWAMIAPPRRSRSSSAASTRNCCPADNPRLLLLPGRRLGAGDRTEEALAAARKAAGSKKDSARFASRVPWILYHAKRNAEAQQAYEELVSTFDGDRESAETRAVCCEARLALSNLCVLAGQHARRRRVAGTGAGRVSRRRFRR